jgi:hypothetical protein
MKNTKLLVSALALVAIGSGASACSSSASPSAGKKPAAPGSAPPAVGVAAGSGSPMTSGSAGTSTGPGSYILQPMPAGTVSFERGAHGYLQARVNLFGLTPGSSHEVSVNGPLGRPVWFPALTANAAGQADATLTSVAHGASVPPFSRFVIRLGNSSSDPLAGEPIAETGVLPAHPQPGSAFVLHAVTSATNDEIAGQPAGRATITYNATAQTLTVTVTASGLNPGPHAAHIHLGSCRNQGGVKYMLADFVADASGNVINQTRVITGVTSVPGPGSWYLNLHQGGMNQILSNGVPTLSFRPMLCTDITSFATTGGAVAASPSVSPSGAPSMSPSAWPAVSPSMSPAPSTPASTPATMPPTSSPSPSGSTSPAATPTNVPTHW